MPVTVKLHSALRQHAGGAAEVSVEAPSVRALPDALERAYPGLGAAISDEHGQLRRFLNLYVNGEDYRFLKGLDTPLQPGDEVTLLIAMGGGE